MPGKKPEYGQGFHDFADEMSSSSDPWQGRYRYGSPVEYGPRKEHDPIEKSSDQFIWKEAYDVLANASGIDATNIEVNVENAVVTLSGTVRTKLEKIKVENLIYDLGRVYIVDVKNEIDVNENQKSLS